MVSPNEAIGTVVAGATDEGPDEILPYLPDLTLDATDARIVDAIPAAVSEQRALRFLRVPANADRNKHVERHREHIRVAAVEATRLAQPRAIYRTLPVEQIDAEGVTLAGGYRFSSEKVAQLLAGTQRVVVAVATLGPAVDDEIRRLLDEKLYVEWYTLNAVGGAMVSEYTSRLARVLHHHAAREGWQALPSLGPGSQHWSLHDQIVVFDVLPADRIGVELTEHCVMVPYKSQSMVIGLGHDLPRRSARGSEPGPASAQDAGRPLG